jgi:putative exosortase-associated protein (TIGR04073 family)
MRGLLLFLCAFSVAVGLKTAPCRAETISICDAASSDDYLTKTSGQFLRGATNISFCWLEMIHQPALEVQSRGNLFAGVAKGVGHTFLRVVKGIGDIATCASPHRNEDGTFPSVTRDCAFGSVGLEDR